MVELFVQFPANLYMHDIIMCLFMISRSELWAITEENADMTQIFFPATSVGVLLRTNRQKITEYSFCGKNCLFKISFNFLILFVIET